MEDLISPQNFSDSFRKGMIFAHRGQFETARSCFEDALSQERNGGDPKRLTVILGNLGNCLAVLGKAQEARTCYEEVLKLQHQASDVRMIGQTLVNLGNLSRELGEAKLAEAYYLEALDFLEKAEDHHSLGQLNSNFGLLAFDSGDFGQAILFFKKAIELHKKTGHEEGLAASWYQLGRTYQRLAIPSDGNKAETCFNYSFMHYHHLGNPSGEVEALRGLADVYETRRDLELALNCLNRALETSQKYRLVQMEHDLERADRLSKLLRG
ncbi:MAG: tetratricopeptide repeat protein [Nitrospirae bacterium]|nr:tetratricopeptide repeat protein [Nitrospirota bacterium]MBI3595080.1 tetratricopeptide repeat protein [Nitrospirota bacterium]